MPNQKRLKPKSNASHYFVTNFIGGIGWAFGMTVGFAVLFYLFGRIFSLLGGLPVIGTIIANLINYTNSALESSPLTR